MGLYDRDYTQEQYEPGTRYGSGMRMGLPGATPAVVWLLTINIAVFFINLLFRPRPGDGLTILEELFALYPTSLPHALQLWRLITYQFLHGDVMHIFLNMLGLYFLGPTLERYWGTKRFVFFYLGCGLAGGLFYLLLVAVGFLGALPMVGASGAILGMLAACAILFPQFVVFIYFFALPIRVAAILLIFLSVATILSKGANAGGEAAHLAGMVAGALYVFSEPLRRTILLRFKAGHWAWQRSRQRKLQLEIDRILEKVHNAGIHSLTAREKRILKCATKLEQSRLR